MKKLSLMAASALMLTGSLAAVPCYANETPQPIVDPCRAKLVSANGSSRDQASLQKSCQSSSLMQRCHEAAIDKRIPNAEMAGFMQRCANMPTQGYQPPRGADTRPQPRPKPNPEP